MLETIGSLPTPTGEPAATLDSTWPFPAFPSISSHQVSQDCRFIGPSSATACLAQEHDPLVNLDRLKYVDQLL